MQGHVTVCHALYHSNFCPRVKLPIDEPRPALGSGLSAKAACEAARAACAASSPAPATPPQSEPTANMKRKHTLVLDIDETLIHTYDWDAGAAVSHGARDGHPKGFEDLSELFASVEKGKSAGINAFINGAQYLKFWTRPFLKEFLEEVTQLFNVVFWTAGPGPYMASIINALERQVLHKMLAGSTAEAEDKASDVPASVIADNTSYMYDLKKNIMAIAADDTAVGSETASPTMNYYGYSRCQTMGPNCLKHLPLLGLENTDNVILMDDAVRSFIFTPRSAILVDPFETKNDNDTFLRDVMPMLRKVAESENAARELDHWRADEYTALDDLDANTQKFLMVSPDRESSMCNEKGIQIGSWLGERRTNGPIAPAALYGTDFELQKRAEIEAEMAKIQGDYTNNRGGLPQYFLDRVQQQLNEATRMTIVVKEARS